MALRWADFITPSTLHLAPLVELLVEPIRSAQQLAALQLGLQEVLVNAVRHDRSSDGLMKRLREFPEFRALATRLVNLQPIIAEAVA